jgi:hypothetical protein
MTQLDVTTILDALRPVDIDHIDIPPRLAGDPRGPRDERRSGISEPNLTARVGWVSAESA